MSSPVKPPTQREMIDQMWWILVGSNGDGVVSQVKVIRSETTKLTQTIPNLATKEDLDSAIDAHECRDIERREAAIQAQKNKAMTAREWLSTIGTVGSFLWPILVGAWLLFFKH